MSLREDVCGAFSFLTILPLGQSSCFEPHKVVQYFPLVGLVLGMMVALVDRALLAFWPQDLVSLLDVLCFTVLSGALHLDGLGDSADGLFSHRSRERALEIMKDSRVGSMGVISIIFILACKWSSLGHLDQSRFFALSLVPAYSRSAVLWAMRYLEYGREQGTGAVFFQTRVSWTAFWSLPLLVACSAVLGYRAIALNMTYALVLVVLLTWYQRKLGGVTGDTLGALIEVQEAFLFLALAVYS